MKKLVFLGNCQATRVQVLYAEKFAPITGDTMDVVASFGEFTPHVRKIMAEADIIISQALDSEHEVNLSKFETKARIIEFPNVSGTFLWPFSGQPRIDNEALPYMADGPYSIQQGNRWMDARIKRGQKPEEIAAEYEALDLSKAVNLDRMYDLLMTAAKRRDERTGFDIAAFIESSFTEKPLFMTPGNLELALFRPLAIGVYTRLGISQAAAEAAFDTQWRSPFPVADYPIHPSVARHFGLKFIGPDTRYRTRSGERITFSEWVSRYVHYRWNHTLLDAAHKGDLARRAGRLNKFNAEAQAILDQVEAGMAGTDGSDYGESIRSNLLHLKGDLAGAIEATRRAAAIDQTNPQIVATLAIYLVEQGKLEQAEQTAKDISVRWPLYADGWNRLAFILGRRGKLADAVAAVRRAVEIEPRNVDYNKHLSSLLLQSGQGEKARHVLTGLITLQPDRADLYAELSRLLVQTGDLDMALIAARRAAALDTNSVPLLCQLAELLVQRSDFDGANIILQRVMAQAPDQPSLIISLANLLLRLGQNELAITELRRAITLEPTTIHLHNQLANVLSAAEDFPGAEQACRDAIEIEPGNIALRGTLSLMVARQGRIDESLVVIADAIALAPEDPHLLAKRTHLLMQKDDLAGARANAERAIAAAPQMAGLRGSLGDVLERQGDISGALAAYRTAAQLETDNLHFRRQAERLAGRAAEAAAAE